MGSWFPLRRELGGGTGGSALNSDLPNPSDSQSKNAYSVNLRKVGLPMCLYPISFVTDRNNFGLKIV